ncbi:MAG: sarcosine oxidase subunit delta [Rhodobacter sp.]|nr:sarcosine oxidase subunit delta [Rhodobacter sp.]MCY4242689.1 sarcosine oxidase subunit delta [Rhodobacter sp.]
MLPIPCPFCGPRNEAEFSFGGPVKPDRPDPQTTSDEDWVEYLTVAPNPIGPVEERWWHVRGCGKWFAIWRDTRTHDIFERPDSAV